MACDLVLWRRVAGFEPLEGGAIEVRTKSGKKYPADVVILALGVRPDVKLAKSAGLAIGERGGIRVDEHMRTSDPNIFAVGDAVEVRDFGTGEPSLVALAGPANRQGRIAADVIAGRESPLPRYAGHVHHRIVRRRGGMDGREREDAEAPAATTDYEKIYLLSELARGLLPGRHAAGAERPSSFSKSDGRVLGAQAVGEDGPAVDKRIERHSPWRSSWARPSTTWRRPSCATRRSSAARRTPVNFAGMVAADVLRRGHAARATGTAPEGSLPARRAPAGSSWPWRACRAPSNIPLPELRSRLGETLPRDRGDPRRSCRSGQRAYYATRILIPVQGGRRFRVKHFEGCT